MRKALLATITAVVISGCSDGASSAAPQLSGFAAIARSRATAVDQLILQFFPKGLETATGKRWDHIDTELGTWNPVTKEWTGNVASARKHLMDLAKFVELKTPDIESSGLVGGETRAHASDRLIFAMNAYAFGGPDALATLPTGGTDLAVAVVPAGQAALVQAPSQQAGVRLDAGSTMEDRVIAVVANAAEPSYARCNGPLNTDRCQYPRFYKFESYPHTKLAKPARFAVCHIRSGPNAPAEGEDNLIRLAHTLPADPANYTEGATQEDGIEILPLAGNTNVVACAEPPVTVGFFGAGQRALYALGKFAGRLIAPKAAHAYDQGPEHFSEFFSDFNAVGLKFNHATFDPTSPLTLAGDAALPAAGGVLLTPSAIWQKGAAWSQLQPYLGRGFEATFTFRISEIGGEPCCNPPGGADGVAFVIRSNGSDIIGGGTGTAAGGPGYGGHMGYMSLAPSFAIEFDTWNNGDGSENGQNYYDADDQHVAVRKNEPSTESVSEVTLAAKTTLQANSIDLEDGQPHEAKIRYVDGILTVTLDGIQLASQAVTLPAGLLDANGRATIGFTSATGLATAKHEILSWKFRAPIASPPPPAVVIQ